MRLLERDKPFSSSLLNCDFEPGVSDNLKSGLNDDWVFTTLNAVDALNAAFVSFGFETGALTGVIAGSTTMVSTVRPALGRLGLGDLFHPLPGAAITPFEATRSSHDSDCATTGNAAAKMATATIAKLENVFWIVMTWFLSFYLFLNKLTE